MAEERYTFAQARTRLEDIVVQVRKKDTSLEKSLDLLEEGVRLANACTELSDHTEWRSVAAQSDDVVGGESTPEPESSGQDGHAPDADESQESDAAGLDSESSDVDDSSGQNADYEGDDTASEDDLSGVFE